MYDLSIVTDALRDILAGALQASLTNPVWGNNPPTYAVSCQHPQDVAQVGVDCDVNLYMFHVVEDRNLLNQFWTQRVISNQPPGKPRQPVAFEPLCLDLHYLLTANSQSSYVHEQQAMSLGMRAFHENAIVRMATPTPKGAAESEITLTMERPTWDELSRLWQALECPMRMTAQYKASVVMLMPEQGLTHHHHVKRYTLLGAPAQANDGTTPELYGTIKEVSVVPPSGVKFTYDQTPASVAPSQEFVLRGINVQDADTVYLITPGGASPPLSLAGWVVPRTIPYTSVPVTGVPIELQAPTTKPFPAPGRYLLEVTGANGTSNQVPVSIAPWIDPAGGPVLVPGAGGVYSFQTANVPAAGAELRLGTILLTQGAPSPGNWSLTGTTLELIPPVGIQPGTYAVRLRAADVEADPALWVSV